ncbi:NlpC/P60 family protein [Streptomyces sp. NPDC006743]|uniref:C40 family peptidase n=1 Tax=Streptomyces sp. NPDC006743 TaxID=3154480 RepID=UPI0034563B64
MSKRALRLVCTAAMAAQAALVPVTAGAQPRPAGPGQGTAGQSPEQPVRPPSEQPVRPSPGGAPGQPSGPLLTLPGTQPDRQPAGRLPEQPSAAALLTNFQALYRQAEQATEAYNAAAQRLERQRAETDRLTAALARARAALRDGRAAAGRLARQEYQGTSDFSPYLRLMLARDPQHALEEGHVIGQLARERSETVARLTASERKAEDLARAARSALDARLALARRQQRARDDVRSKLHAIEKLLASLSPARLTALAAAEEAGIARAQDRLLASGTLGGDRPPTPQGEAAVRYAVDQLGKPYQWGATGPAAYDCSGLTSRAWGQAGTPIPRTSQEQWAELAHVPLKELRPGDLVVYFPEATHVALYLGHGLVVQAPRPGARVKVSPLAANPVLGAVRPDPAGKPLPRYTPPRLPALAGDPAAGGPATVGPPAGFGPGKPAVL